MRPVDDFVLKRLEALAALGRKRIGGDQPGDAGGERPGFLCGGNGGFGPDFGAQLRNPGEAAQARDLADHHHDQRSDRDCRSDGCGPTEPGQAVEQPADQHVGPHPDGKGCKKSKRCNQDLAHGQAPRPGPGRRGRQGVQTGLWRKKGIILGPGHFHGDGKACGLAGPCRFGFAVSRSAPVAGGLFARGCCGFVIDGEGAGFAALAAGLGIAHASRSPRR
jgi:hypothetical protein